MVVYPEDELIKKMREKLETDEGKNIYRSCMSTVEPVHGDMQKNMGFIQFALRGLEKVNSQPRFVFAYYIPSFWQCVQHLSCLFLNSSLSFSLAFPSSSLGVICSNPHV